MKRVADAIKILLMVTVFPCLQSCNNDGGKQSAADSTAQAKSTLAEVVPPPNPDRNCYFGDLHLHTSYSADAFLMGGKGIPEDSYRYAMGDTVSYLGHTQQRKAPLDFLAVTDHSEYLGIMSLIPDPDGEFKNTDWYRRFTSTDRKVKDTTYLMLVQSLFDNKPYPEFMKGDLLRSNWQKVIAAADKYNKPGKFTALVGFEWTSAPTFEPGKGQNLHRCVIFKGNKVPVLPFSSFDSQDPEELWTYLENARKEGDDVIAVPHNGNASNGLMFDTKTLTGKALTKEYALRRMANEPLTEIIQGKGQSETNPAISKNDEFANFELWETLVGNGTKAKFMKGSYLRQAYGVGQELQEKIGANPFKYGIEAGTDYHSGLSSTEEGNYWGSHGTTDDLHADPGFVLNDTATFSAGGESTIVIGAGGLTGIWSEQNTRESLFDALKRKECFGTSGSRIKVRMFASRNYDPGIVDANDWVKQAYAAGVPMGADLPQGNGNPKFIVQAVKDPNSGNLDRIQIVKVATKKGKTTEQVIDITWSDNRKKDVKTGKVPAVGNTVDLKTATYTNSIGAAELIGFWEDKDFDPSAYITYYARVLEIPTPRWSTVQAVRNGYALNKKVQPFIQERAWTSPVWYVPSK
ncbi:DUF3604 domain-containing protein [Flavitalea antarctica]